VDPVDSHRRWAGDIRDVTGHALNFPLIADPERTVAQLYDMIHPSASETVTVRSVFVIGPDNKVKLYAYLPGEHVRFPGAAPGHRLAPAHRRPRGRHPGRLAGR
jgi:alkyl hydroperoxide reductase subunit AhpC